MTDGPFRNAALSKSWKRYGRNLVSDASSVNDRAIQACRSMVKDVEIKNISSILSDLKSLGLQPQMDLDPSASIEKVFNKYDKSPLADSLERQLSVYIQDKIPLNIALDLAVKATVKEWVKDTENRMVDECVTARDKGDMILNEYPKALKNLAESFNSIDQSILVQSCYQGPKALKSIVNKKDGLDEGPEE